MNSKVTFSMMAGTRGVPVAFERSWAAIVPRSLSPTSSITARRVQRLVSTSSHTRTAISPDNTVVVPAAAATAATLTTLKGSLPPKKQPATLSSLPLSAVVRSYLIMSMSSSPFILNTGMYGLRKMLDASSALFDPERNLLLRWLFKKTFYAQFCAGENKAEVQECMRALEKVGYQGIVLEYASEVLADGNPVDAAKVTADIDSWRMGCLESIDMARPGDLVAMKWSGMGSEALRLLKQNAPPSPQMAQAMADICEAAAKKSVHLLPAAEPQNAQAAVDQWTLNLAIKYNKAESGVAIVYNTYQCYLKSTPETLARHLAHAAKNNYILGVKLVRGAYLETEKRSLIWDTIEETHHAYDELAKQTISKQWDGMLLPPEDSPKSPFPDVNVMLATHNLASVKKGIELRKEQINSGQKLTRMCFAQLQGMADEVSCELVQDQRYLHKVKGVPVSNLPKVFKYVTWGTTGQCLHYLLRRAEENKDAIGRTKTTSRAMRDELLRRVKKTLFWNSS